jgi:hypothetical protein
LARTLASLDVLCGGRLILGVAIGDGGSSFDAFGESAEARIRAEKLDEALEIITRLWSGDEISHRGKHFVVEKFALTALPLQRPRIPIWVGGDGPPALRRAARWDGWIGPDEDPLAATPDDLITVCRNLQGAGASLQSFDVAWAGKTDIGDEGSVADYQSAGATWWIEVILGSREEILARVAAGPPTVQS